VLSNQAGRQMAHRTAAASHQPLGQLGKETSRRYVHDRPKFIGTKELALLVLSPLNGAQAYYLTAPHKHAAFLDGLQSVMKSIVC